VSWFCSSCGRSWPSDRIRRFRSSRRIANGLWPKRGSGGAKCWAGPILAQFSRIIMLIKKKFRAEINIFSGLFFLDKLIMLIMFILGHNFNCHA
jgi:hypothetical protein